MCNYSVSQIYFNFTAKFCRTPRKSVLVFEYPIKSANRIQGISHLTNFLYGPIVVSKEAFPGHPGGFHLKKLLLRRRIFQITYKIA